MKKLISYLWQRLGQLLLWVTATLGSTPTTSAPPERALYGSQLDNWADDDARWFDWSNTYKLDFGSNVVYDDVQSGISKGETNLLTKTKTKNVVATKAGARWEVVNLKTDKTVKFAKSRDAARAIRATYAKPTAYGIYDTVSQKFVR